MKTLKLEVGKIYRSREGKEVKIVGMNRESGYQFKGSNGEWYKENGSFWYHEHPYDLIEEVSEALTAPRHTFAIPDGVKEITLDYFGNRIVVEMVPEEGPKPGDVLVNEQGSVYIFKAFEGRNTYKHYCALLRESGHLFIGGSCFSGRHTTPEEAQPLFDALKKAGKRWNPETMQVEEITEKERIEEFLKGYAIDSTWIYWLIEGYLKYKEGEK